MIACGVVDAEAAQSVLDLRSQILEIQTNEVDPMVQKISDLDSEYSILVNSQEALDLTLTVRNIRDSLKNLDDF